MKKEYNSGLILSRAVLFLVCLVLSLLLWLTSMWIVAPKETRAYESIAVTVSDGEEVVHTVSAKFSATRAELYRYMTEGITATVFPIAPISENDEVEVFFFCGDEQIIPVTPVFVKMEALS